MIVALPRARVIYPGAHCRAPPRPEIAVFIIHCITGKRTLVSDLTVTSWVASLNWHLGAVLVRVNGHYSRL